MPAPRAIVGGAAALRGVALAALCAGGWALTGFAGVGAGASASRHAVRADASVDPASGEEQEPARAPDSAEARAQLVAALDAQSVRIDFEAGWAAIPCEVVVRGDLLEYLLVNRSGAAHESLFATEVAPSVLNAALLALGATPGANARWVPKEGVEGRPAFDVVPPAGDGFYLHVAWRRADELHFHRLEDLVLDRASGGTLRRQKFVYLGSRMVALREGEPPVFAADIEGNLVNVSFFEAGRTLLTTATPECVRQTVWLPNGWLLPQQGEAATLVFARTRLSQVPAPLADLLVDLGPLKAPEAR
ncbi:MAG: hypothetical protein RIR65_1583 [Planctomycetota bacterium]